VNKDAPHVQRDFAYMCQNALLPTLCLVCLPTLAACAKRKNLPEDELFRRIQVHEAVIADAEHVVIEAQTCRAAYEPAERGVCDESKALCKLTQDAEQIDATHRCLIASDTCRAMRERARALCATSSGSRTEPRAASSGSRTEPRASTPVQQ
jgi:hypothetical protein